MLLMGKRDAKVHAGAEVALEASCESHESMSEESGVRKLGICESGGREEKIGAKIGLEGAEDVNQEAIQDTALDTLDLQPGAKGLGHFDDASSHDVQANQQSVSVNQTYSRIVFA